MCLKLTAKTLRVYQTLMNVPILGGARSELFRRPAPNSNPSQLMAKQ